MDSRDSTVVLAQGSATDRSSGRITVDADKCIGCHCCELACSLHNYGECNPSRARIYVACLQGEGGVTASPVLCQQCEDPLCVTMCPAGALQREPRTHAVVVDRDKCLGCRTCVEVCPFGGPAVDPRTGTSEKCDLCDGDPICVKVCSQRAIRFVSAREESQYRKRAGAGKYVDYLRTHVSGGE